MVKTEVVLVLHVVLLVSGNLMVIAVVMTPVVDMEADVAGEGVIDVVHVHFVCFRLKLIS